MHLSQAFPFALLVLAVILLAAMPWHRPHPNYQFMLQLLKSHLADEPPGVQDSTAGDRSWRLLNPCAGRYLRAYDDEQVRLVMLDLSRLRAGEQNGSDEHNEFQTTEDCCISDRRG